MNIGAISKRYAKALLAFATENGKEDTVYKEVKSFVRQFREMEDLRKAIESPAVPKLEKLKLLDEAAGHLQTSPELMRFFKLVLDEKREKLFIFIQPYRDERMIKPELPEQELLLPELQQLLLQPVQLQLLPGLLLLFLLLI